MSNLETPIKQHQSIDDSLDKSKIDNSIAIIIPYFGKWPEWIDLYIYSCEKNKDIDWFFFTDCEKKISKKKNINFTYMTFNTYCNMVSERLNVEFKPVSAYKLCDLKVFYGYIHRDILINYNFWGFGDVDLIWGNIKNFYTDKLLNKFDVLSTHGDRVSGHLCILRNEIKYTELCFKIKKWQQKLKDPNNNFLDEVYFSRLIYPESKYVVKVYTKFIRKIFNWRDSWVIYNYFLPIINVLTFSRLRRIYFKEQHTTPILSHDGLSCKHDADVWYYKNGNITNNKTSKEYIYVHFMILKKNGIRSDYYWNDNYYLLDKDNDFSKGVKISKKGFEKL